MQSFNLFVVLIVTLSPQKMFKFMRHFITCSERVKKIYPRNLSHFRETVSDKLDSFGIKYSSEHNLSKTLPILDYDP